MTNEEFLKKYKGIKITNIHWDDDQFMIPDHCNDRFVYGIDENDEEYELIVMYTNLENFRVVEDDYIKNNRYII